MPYISHVATRPADFLVTQESIIDHFRAGWVKAGVNPDVLTRFHRSVQVQSRHLAYPVETYSHLEGFGQRNRLWSEAVAKLTYEAVAKVIETSKIDIDTISLVASATCTGIMIPTIEAHLFNRIPFRLDTKRLPIMGLGCLAGVAGVNRVVDYLRAFPQSAAIFVTCEICSLTWQPNDLSTANMVATGLFADGCAAVIILGDEHPLVRNFQGPLLRCHQGRSHFFPNSERVMGFDIEDSGFKVVLSPDVPKLVEENIPGLSADMLAFSELAHWDRFICHPGGPKVIKALEQSLKLDHDELVESRRSLKTHGNMSSASVLFILAETLKRHDLRSGEHALMLAMGPAFCAELSHLEVV